MRANIFWHLFHGMVLNSSGAQLEMKTVIFLGVVPFAHLHYCFRYGSCPSRGPAFLKALQLRTNQYGRKSFRQLRECRGRSLHHQSCWHDRDNRVSIRGCIHHAYLYHDQVACNDCYGAASLSKRTRYVSVCMYMFRPSCDLCLIPEPDSFATRLWNRMSCLRSGQTYACSVLLEIFHPCLHGLGTFF